MMVFNKQKFMEDVSALRRRMADVCVGHPPEEAMLAAIQFAAWCGALSTVKNGAPRDAIVEMGDYFKKRYDEVVLMMLDAETVEETQMRGEPN